MAPKIEAVVLGAEKLGKVEPAEFHSELDALEYRVLWGSTVQRSARRYLVHPEPRWCGHLSQESTSHSAISKVASNGLEKHLTHTLTLQQRRRPRIHGDN
jgi:hypothetical protein